MKILHILDHSIPLHSGYTFRTRAILEQQRKLGWETYHITSAKHAPTHNQVETIDGLKFYRTSFPQAKFARLPVINQMAIVNSLSKRLDEIIPEIKPDILHAHSPVLNGLAALKMAKKYRIPLVYECRAFWEDAAVDHGTCSENSLRYRLSKALETYLFKKANAITTICNGLRNDIISRGVAPEKITVIANAVDIDKFHFGLLADSQLQSALNLNGKTVLGFIGSFYAYEGILLLLEALASIIKEQPNLCLLLVGGGPQEQNIIDAISTLNIENHVILTGRVSHDSVQNYYNLVDIFVYPRLSMRLTELVTPLKPLEAMAQGRLVIASDVGGHHELIHDKQTGYLFKAGDVTALGKTILYAMADKANWQIIRHNGRQFVDQERNWQTSVAHYQTVYANLLTTKTI